MTFHTAVKSAILLAALFGMPYKASAQSFAIKVNAGSLGAGGEIAMRVHPVLNARVGGNWLDLSYLYETGPDDDFDINASLILKNASAMLDWHPFGGTIRVSAGVVYNNNNVRTDLMPKQTYRVGGEELTPQDLGTVTARLTFKPVSPAATLGFGNALRGKRAGLILELGMVYQGPPHVSMEADGLLAPSAEQADVLEENLEWFIAYPVITLSLYLRVR